MNHRSSQGRLSAAQREIDRLSEELLASQEHLQTLVEEQEATYEGKVGAPTYPALSRGYHP